MDKSGYSIQYLLMEDVNKDDVCLGRKLREDTTEERTAAQVAVARPSYGGSFKGRAGDSMVSRTPSEGLPLHKSYDCFAAYSNSTNFSRGGASGYESASASDSLWNVNSDGRNWYTPDVGQTSSLSCERGRHSFFSGGIFNQTSISADETHERKDRNTPLRPTPTGNSQRRISATISRNSTEYLSAI